MGDHPQNFQMKKVKFEQRVSPLNLAYLIPVKDVRGLIWWTYLNYEDRALVWAAHDKKKEPQLVQSVDFRRMCTKHGYINIVKWIHGAGVCLDAVTSIEATLWGHWDILKWMQGLGILVDDRGCLTAGAALGGHFDILKWLREHNYTWGVYVCRNAAAIGDINMLQWLKDNGCPWDEWACYMAVIKGKLGTLKWLIENGCPYDSLTLRLKAMQSHYMDVSKWVRENVS